MNYDTVTLRSRVADVDGNRVVAYRCRPQLDDRISEPIPKVRSRIASRRDAIGIAPVTDTGRFPSIAGCAGERGNRHYRTAGTLAIAGSYPLEEIDQQGSGCPGSNSGRPGTVSVPEVTATGFRLTTPSETDDDALDPNDSFNLPARPVTGRFQAQGASVVMTANWGSAQVWIAAL